MTTYYANFNNTTSQTWTMGVYQTLPDSEGLDTVSWKQTTVPQNGTSGVAWDVVYDVALANYVQNGGIGVYTASQTLQADLGTKWQCVWQDNVQQLVPSPAGSSGAASGDQIVIQNTSGQLANLGIGMSGQGAVFKLGVDSGSEAMFVVTPTYYVGLFNDVQLGQVISSDTVTAPQELVYPDGLNLATVTATLNGANLVVKIAYSHANAADVRKLCRAA